MPRGCFRCISGYLSGWRDASKSWKSVLWALLDHSPLVYWSGSDHLFLAFWTDRCKRASEAWICSGSRSLVIWAAAAFCFALVLKQAGLKIFGFGFWISELWSPVLNSQPEQWDSAYPHSWITLRLMKACSPDLDLSRMKHSPWSRSSPRTLSPPPNQFFETNQFFSWPGLLCSPSRDSNPNLL